MPMNRVQFQSGLALPDFLERYGSQAACEAAILRERWPDGFVCPHCTGRRYSYFERGGERLWQCSACHRQTSLLAGTIFENTKLPLTKWFLALYFLTQAKNNVSALELTRHLGVCYRTAWRLKHKVMQAMAHQEEARRLAGFVQVDDAYLGGERRGGKRGRGSENKRPFVAAVATNENGHPTYAAFDTVPAFSEAAMTRWAQRRLAPDAEVYSDGLAAFRAVVALDHAHTVIATKDARARCEAAGAKWVNTVLGNMKRALDGTYHHIKFFKYSERYLAEAAWRFNRRFELVALVPKLLTAVARCPGWTEKRLRGVPSFVC